MKSDWKITPDQQSIDYTDCIPDKQWDLKIRCSGVSTLFLLLPDLSLALFPDPLSPRVILSIHVLSLGQKVLLKNYLYEIF